MMWSAEAREMLEQLLQELPLPVREGVQQAAELRAEKLAEKESAREVALELAVAASTVERSPQKVRWTSSAGCFPRSAWNSICSASSRDLRRVPMGFAGPLRSASCDAWR